MRLREVYRYELAYRLRSPSTWLYALFLFLVMLWGLAATADGSSVVHANAPQKLAEGLVLFGGTFGLLVSAALFGDAAIRDVAVGMEPLLYTTRLRKVEFLGGRFLAALTVNAIVIIALPLGNAVGASLLPFDADAFGPFRLAAYLQPFLFFLLPNLVLVGAILFTIGALSRQAIPVYLGAIAIFIGYIVAANYWQHIDNPMLSALGDPLGINAMMEMHRYWTPAEQESRLIGFPTMLVWNRVLWLAVAAMVLAALHRAFRFAHPSGGGRRSKGEGAIVDAGTARPMSSVQLPVAAHRTAGVFGLRTRLQQTLSIARRAFGDVMAGRAFPLVLAGATGLVLLIGWNVTETVFETSTWPVTSLVAGTVLSQRIGPIPWIIIILYAGELVWKERETGASEIADAVPVPEGIVLLGRFLALVAMIVLLQAALMAGGILLQTLQGYYRYELGLYARILFGLNFIELVLFAALAITVHTLVNHKYVGHIVALSAVVFTQIAPALGVRHHLLVYNTDPGWQYSDMNGFGSFAGPFLWFKLYWAAWALLLGVVATLFWTRGREPGLRRRFATARARFSGLVARTAGVAAVLILGIGGFVFYNTNVLHEYRTRDEAGLPQAEYEKRYVRFAKTPQPTITGAKLRVELHPGETAVDLRGSYRLVNRTDRAIDSVHVYLTPNIEGRSFSFDRAAKPVVTDTGIGYRIYALDRGLEPGDSLQLTFDVGFRGRGFSNDGGQTDLVGNGSYFDRRWLPFIGYQPMFELTSDEARKQFGLEPQPPMLAADDAGAMTDQEQAMNADRVHVETIIGTSADQTATTTGMLRRSWTENGRRYFQYESEGAVSFGTPIFSARYAVLEDRWNDVALQVFHHPAHREHLDAVVRGMKASLDYFTKNFGPYPFRQLRVAEVPPYGIFGRAHGGTIAFSEALFFSRVGEGELDQAFYGTAHEIGHQWQVTGPPVRGIGFQAESFANYSAVMVIEKTYGLEAARRAYGFHMERYLVGRAEQSREVPVLEVERQPYIMYRKGAIALYTLRDFIGEEAMNAALRRYLDRYRNAGPPYPTARDLYTELRAATPDSLHTLLIDLFETVTLWNVKADSARAEPLPGGGYRVTLDVVAKKTRADSIGVETETPMDDFIDIGVFAEGEGDALGAPLYLQRHRIRSGRQSIAVTVPRRPSRAGIDPYRKLIDREREDNVIGVQATTSAAKE